MTHGMHNLLDILAQGAARTIRGLGLMTVQTGQRSVVQEDEQRHKL